MDCRKIQDDDTVIAVDLKNEPHGKYSGPNIAKWDDSNDPTTGREQLKSLPKNSCNQSKSLIVVEVLRHTRWKGMITPTAVSLPHTVTGGAEI